MSTHNLTSELVLREAYDPTAGALKTIPSSATSFAIELDSADGDNVTAKPDVSLISDVTASSCVGMKSAAIYTEAGAAAGVKLQVSPVDSGNIWMDVPSSTIATSLTLVVSSGVLSICARRIQVVVTSGTPVYHLVMQSV